MSINQNSLSAATSYLNSYTTLVEILCRRILEDNWFPVVNRPGFHSERPDSHSFLEQWIPYDYANQYYELDDNNQEDLADGRFGDWSVPPSTWSGYHPSFHDYQSKGNCRRKIFRCLNVGTRFKIINKNHVQQAFREARYNSKAILAYANHDYRDIRPDIKYITDIINEVKTDYDDVKVKYSGAREAAVDLNTNHLRNELKLSMLIEGNKFIVKVTSGEVYGSQPFLSIKTVDNKFYHDNFDIIEPNKIWSYTFDAQTFELSKISEVGAGSAGREGSFYVNKITLKK